MHGLISLLLLYKKNSQITDSVVSGQRTLRIERCINNDNRFLNNGQWAGHNDQWAGHSVHAWHHDSGG